MQPALVAIAVMGCKYSSEMLKAYWRRPADASVPSPDTPNPAAVQLQALLSGVAKRPPPCLWHMAARRPPSRIPGAAARRPALRKSPQHVLLGSASDHLTIIPLPSVHACMPALVIPCLLLPLHLQLTYHSLKTCAGAPGWLQSMFLHPSHAHLSAILCFCPGARGLFSGLSTRPSSALGLMPGMLCMFLHKLRLFLGCLVQLCTLLL